MPAPNLVNVAEIIGVTDTTQPSSSAQFYSVFTVSTVPTDYVYKVNTVLVSNVTNSNILVKLRTGSAYLAYDISIPAGSSLALVGKDTPIYVEEGNDLEISCDTAQGCWAITSYEKLKD